MSEVLVQFDEPQHSADGRTFVAQVHTSRMVNGLWEAWLEFHPIEGGEPVRTRRETEQLTRGDLRYWSAGVTRAYLADALERALAPCLPGGSLSASVNASVSAPAPMPEWLRPSELTVLETSLLQPQPPLDPSAVFRAAGEHALRHELRSLDARELRDIIVAYGIPEIDTLDFARTFEDALAERIVAGVQQRVDAAWDTEAVNIQRTAK